MKRRGGGREEKRRKRELSCTGSFADAVNKLFAGWSESGQE